MSVGLFANGLLGLLAGVLLAAFLHYNALVGIGVAALLLVAILIAIKPNFGVILFTSCVIVIEEFPSTYGETVERSLRTPFYSKSLGIPGLYSTDVILAGLLILYLLIFVLKRRSAVARFDRVGICLAMLGSMIVLSTVVAFFSDNPLPENALAGNPGTLYKVNERGARLVGFYQIKIYSYLFLSYLLGMMYFDSHRRIREFIAVFAASSVISVGIAAFRLWDDPRLVSEMRPLVYHSASSWIFATVISYIVVAWASGLFARNQLIWLVILSVLLTFLIVASFRRSMWVAISLSTVPLIWLIPNKAKIRLAIYVGAGVSLAAILLMMFPVGEAAVSAISGRVEGTTLADKSTLYRFSLLIHLVNTFGDIPIFGYGARPLWDKVVTLGFFRTNLENVHSLYYWILLRTGYAGLAVAVIAFAGIGRRLWVLARRMEDARHRALAAACVQSVVIFLLSGITNPVYGEARYMIILGLELALMTYISRADSVPGGFGDGLQTAGHR